MNAKQKDRFLLDPVAYLGDRAMTIQPQVHNETGATTQNLQVPYISGTYRYCGLVAPRNTTDFFLNEDSDRNRIEIAKSNPKRQHCKIKGYYLPWAENEIYKLRLDNLKNVDIFFTAEVNGCCIYIAGQQISPIVIHANMSTEDLEDINLKGIALHRMGQVLREHQVKIYGKNYWALQGKLIGRSLLPDDSPITILDPGTYFEQGGNKARIFGIKRDGNWVLYVNLETSRTTGLPPRKVIVTARLWPDPDWATIRGI